MTLLLGLAIGAALAFVALAARIFTGLAVKEVDGWIPRISELMVRRAAEHLPTHVAPRWVEEQCRHLEEYDDRPFSMLLHAVEVVRQTRRLAVELRCDTQAAGQGAPAGTHRIVAVAAAVARRMSGWPGRVQDVARRAFEAVVAAFDTAPVAALGMAWSAVLGAFAMEPVIGGTATFVEKLLPVAAAISFLGMYRFLRSERRHRGR